MRLLILFLLVGFSSFGQQSQKEKDIVNSKAKLFNDSAIKILFETKDCKKAIFLFNKAINIDSNYLLPLKGKLSCLIGLKQYKNAIQVAKRWNEIDSQTLSPFPNPSSIIGILYEKLSDTTNSKTHFKNALNRVNKILDTMNVENATAVLMEKAIILILLGEHKSGNAILQQVYESPAKNILNPQALLFLNKSRKEVISRYFSFK